MARQRDAFRPCPHSKPRMHVLSGWRTPLVMRQIRKRLRSMVATVRVAFSRRPRWARWAAAAAAALLGLLIAFNVALNLGASPRLLSSLVSMDPQSLSVGYRRAWSF